MDALSVFLNRQMATPFVWGQSDCCLMAADWVWHRFGSDPAADLRLTYGSPSECQRVTRFLTDPVAVVGPRLRAIGVPEATIAGRGDVGIVMLRVGARSPMPHGAVCLGYGGQWAVKGEAGLTVVASPGVVKIWEVGCA